MPTLIHSQTRHATRHVRRGPLALLAQMFATRRQRRSLADLDDALLRDIGLDRYQALLESRRPLWDLPGAGRK